MKTIPTTSLIALPAADLAASVTFYRDVIGLRVAGEHPDVELPSVDFDLGGTRLRIYTWTKAFKRGGHSGLLIGVDDLDAALSIVGKGEARMEPWGGRVATLSDPDGNLFDLLEQSYLDQLD